jgi:hypothetical protein
MGGVLARYGNPVFFGSPWLTIGNPGAAFGFKNLITVTAYILNTDCTRCRLPPPWYQTGSNSLEESLLHTGNRNNEIYRISCCRSSKDLCGWDCRNQPITIIHKVLILPFSTKSTLLN